MQDGRVYYDPSQSKINPMGIFLNSGEGFELRPRFVFLRRSVLQRTRIEVLR